MISGLNSKKIYVIADAAATNVYHQVQTIRCGTLSPESTRIEPFHPAP